MRRTTTLLSAAALVAAMAAVPVSAAGTPSNACDNRTNNTYKKLLECVTLDGARAHQWELQKIADANNGIRTSGTPGYDASADYAAQVFEDAGLDVSVQEFTFQTFIALTPTVLERVSPAPAGSITNNVLNYSGSGDVTAPVSSPSATDRSDSRPNGPSGSGRRAPRRAWPAVVARVHRRCGRRRSTRSPTPG